MVNEKKDGQPDKRLLAFRLWIDQVPEDRLRDMLVTAFWKHQIDETEMVRFFCLEFDYGIKMIPVARKRRA